MKLFWRNVEYAPDIFTGGAVIAIVILVDITLDGFRIGRVDWLRGGSAKARSQGQNCHEA